MRGALQSAGTTRGLTALSITASGLVHAPTSASDITRCKRNTVAAAALKYIVDTTNEVHFHAKINLHDELCLCVWTDWWRSLCVWLFQDLPPRQSRRNGGNIDPGLEMRSAGAVKVKSRGKETATACVKESLCCSTLEEKVVKNGRCLCKY